MAKNQHFGLFDAKKRSKWAEILTSCVKFDAEDNFVVYVFAMTSQKWPVLPFFDF